MPDESLATSSDQTPDPTPGVALGVSPDVIPEPVKSFTVDDVLSRARRIERVATICLRADLQGEWDELLDELSGLVTASGELIDNEDEADMATVSASGRVTQITERLSVLRRTMAGEMWRVRFRGMASDEWQPFVKKNKPKEGTDHTDYFNLLIAETAIEPTLSVEQVKELRKVLTFKSINTLIVKAFEACTEGGLDVPKLPISLRNLADQ